MGATAENAAEAPLAHRERRGSWADAQHRPKHMRWRDKLAYVEHHHQDSEAGKVAEACADNTTAPLGHRERRSSWADAQHRPKHMRWRDKVAYVEHHNSDSKTSTRADRTSEDSCESTGDTLNDVQTSADSKTKQSKPHHYSETFTHHPPHITFREKMKFLQGDHRNSKDSKREDQKAHKRSSRSARSSSAQLPPRAPTSQLTSSNNNEGIISSPSMLRYSEKRLLGLPYPALAS